MLWDTSLENLVMIPRGIFPVLLHLSNTAQVLTMWHVTRTYFSCSTDISYISGGPWIFMMLLYADVYCQSNCLSVPDCQVLRGVIHNNNRAKAESGHWTGDLKKPVRDLGKFPTHHRSSVHPIPSYQVRCSKWPNLRLHSDGRFTSSTVSSIWYSRD